MYNFLIRPARSGYLTLVLVGLMGACVGQDSDADQALDNASELPSIELFVADGVVLDASARSDADALRESMSDMRSTLGPISRIDSPLIIEYLGRGELVNRDLRVPAKLASPFIDGTSPDPEDTEFRPWTTVRVETGNEFRVWFPAELLHQADEQARAEGLQDGWDPDLADGELPTEAIEAAQADEKGWSNGVDTRVVKGTYGVAQTHTAYKKLVSMGTNGGCSGTLVGPKHVVTAAHCIRNFKNSSWYGSTAYAGRSGPSAYRASAQYNPDPSIASTWYWLPSAFLSIADGQSSMPFSATPYDIGVIVTHTSRMGDVVGWMGWYWWSSDATFGSKTKYNRGYPVCGRSNSPATCNANVLALYGDNNTCQTGEYSSPDGDGINRRFRTSCDLSGGHSGSSLYHYLDGSTLVVTGIVSWEHCTTCGAGDDRPNTAVRITKEYSGAISWLRQTFP